MITSLYHHLKIWLRFGAMSFQITFINRNMIIFFMLGKIVRYAMSLVLLFTLRSSITTIGTYSIDQLVVFFIIYLTIDSLSQMMYRGVYEFGSKVKSGSLDFELTKPFSPLFRALLGSPDINDIALFIPMTALNIYIVSQLGIEFSAGTIVLFGLLFFNGFLIATAFHIFVLALGILTTEIENAIFLYRDVGKQGQFPITLQREFLRWILFFIVPIGVMMTVPAQALLGLQLSVGLIWSLAIGIIFLSLSLWSWHEALKRYTSASS